MRLALEEDRVQVWSQSQWITLLLRMRALALALLCLGWVSLWGLEAAQPDLASGFKRKWGKWQQQQQRRARRELPSAALFGGAPAAEANLLPASASKPFVRPQEAKDQPSHPEDSAWPGVALVRVKRYHRQGAPSLSQLHAVRSGCRLGTCNTANLAHKIFHLTDKDKDSTAPANKLSAHGYGRRRRKRRRRR
ncbi:pro-adrenomedullin [Sceloporus undulatus]|uniref:pro-adrenomedullin n=1 Tax=Sceloporus undulatus TaxID=8520 RepID=UPI001C4D02E1|nr:pro-adrenomedullin [Sceloporus undulatus]